MATRGTRVEQGRRSTIGTFLTGCVAGALVGALLGVIYAPHRGDITRRKVVRKAGATKDQVVEAVEEQMNSLKAQKGTSDADEKTAS